ncbi:class I SAM-dependent methyltransferase [Sphingomonas quercus]|uniref:Class I SAM-dependent methyltransferase n=1 Tax=Sphingomonas quercus TaxID=2842451 RepID=A0ABS6BJ24_9SPHN|nr:class I SAM-dependent methyltransferase [Sphingomonas quercus]MBU3077617.1 class I SAM-dependent methyltransferase [Sphingomonas quercus]
MQVSEEIIRDVYRGLLGREPENEDVVRMHAASGRTLAETLASALQSEEFRSRFRAPGDPARIGRHLEARENRVEVDCTPDQEQAMFERIARHWQSFGETEPYWSVLTNPLFFKDTLPEHIDGFFEHGRSDVERSLNYLRRADLACEHVERALDFGCGVGRLTVALARYANTVVGVDISPGHLREAEKSAARFGIDNAQFRLISNVADLDTIGNFDLIVSRIVLQHNPPPVMAALYRKLLGCLRPRGMAVVQMPTYIAGQSFAVAPYLSGPEEPMEMNALPQHEIFSIIEASGCRVIEVRECSHLGDVDGISHTFAVQRRA